MASNYSKLSFFFCLMLFQVFQTSRSDVTHVSCHQGCGSVPIRFPFQMITNPPENRCGYPNFTIVCKNETKNILTFPNSGDFNIDKIDYMFQRIWISDPDGCTAERLLQGFDYSDTPFLPLRNRQYKLFNCSPDSPIFLTGAMAISCLSSENYLVVALPTTASLDGDDTLRCTEMAPVNASSDYVLNFITLTWQEPECQRCEIIGGICQFDNDKGLAVACFRPYDIGFGISGKYAALFFGGSGLLVFAFIMCIRCHIKHQSQHDGEISNSTTSMQRNVVEKGMDRPAIEMYPTTLVGESLELPKSTDNICPICLFEYQAKETLRTIPSCMHYFHADCIDEWLKRNATCPLCRN